MTRDLLCVAELTARERIHHLMDSGTFVELDKHKAQPPGDGVVTGYGRVDGRQVFVWAQNPTEAGGFLSAEQAAKVCKVMDLATQVGAPIIGLTDSGVVPAEQSVASLGGYADIFLRNTLASGVVPQIACVMGPCTAGAVYSPAISDFVFMVQNSSSMVVNGPDVLKAMGNEEVTQDALGGGRTHAEKSGVAHFVHHNDAACLEAVRELLGFLPPNNADDPPE